MRSSRRQAMALLSGMLIAPAMGLAAAPGAAERADDAIAARLRDRALGSAEAEGIVASLTTEVGARLAGSEADARAVAWAVAKFDALGFDRVRMEPVRFPVWRRVSESASVIAPVPQRLVVTALGGSIGTAGPLVSDVVLLDGVDALHEAAPERVRGRIVMLTGRTRRDRDGAGYVDMLPQRTVAASIAARHGALALLIRSLGTSNNRFAHTGSVVYEGPEIPAAALSNPDADLLEALAQNGAPVRLSMDLRVATEPSYTSHNVIGDILGRERPREIVMLSAHLDSWDLGTGAVDDGFGVAAVMAAAALVKRIAGAPRRTIRVVLFANEENGFHGARAYAARDPNELARHRIALESDWGGGRIRALRHAPPDGALAQRLARVLAPLGVVADDAKGMPGPDVGFLAQRGVPWMQLAQDADTLFDVHHTANDTLDKIDPAALRQNVAAHAASAWLLANSA